MSESYLGRNNLIKREEVIKLVRFYIETYLHLDDVGRITYMNFDSNGDLLVQSEVYSNELEKVSVDLSWDEKLAYSTNVPGPNCYCSNCAKARKNRKCNCNGITEGCSNCSR